MVDSTKLIKVKGDVGIDATICLDDVNLPEARELTDYEWQLLGSLRTLIRNRINLHLEGGTNGEEGEEEKGNEDQEAEGPAAVAGPRPHPRG